MSVTPLLSGLLKKKSPKSVLGRHVWQERFFVLTDTQLLYYKSQKDFNASNSALKQVGAIALNTIIKIRVLRTKGAGRFDLLTSKSDRIWAFRADQRKYDGWIQALQAAIVACNNGENIVEQAKEVKHEAKTNHRAGITSSAPKSDNKNQDTKKNDADRELIRAAVNGVATFKNLLEQELSAVVKEMYRINVPKGTTLLAEGEKGAQFFIVASGRFDVNQDDLDTDGKVRVKQLGPREAFAELNLLFEQESDYEYTAAQDSICFAIDRGSYRNVLKLSRQARFQERVQFVKNTELLGRLGSRDQDLIAEALEERSFKSGTNIVEQGQEGDAFYLLVKGEARAFIDGQEVKHYSKKGEFFGERSLLREEVRAATVTAGSTGVVALSLNRHDFKALLGDVAQSLNTMEAEYKVARQNSGSLSQPATRPSFRPSIWDEGDNATTTTAGGGKSLLPEGFIAEEGSSGDDLTDDDEDGAESSSTKQSASSSSNGLSIDNLNIIGTLGKGTFGHVQLVEDKATKKMYALKAVNKAHVLEHDQLDHLKYEKDVQLELGDHPFIVKLYATLQDKNFIYFLLEPSLGGELFSLLREEDTFDKATAQFYAGSIVLAFQYMHGKNILYRDLKPENLLLDTDGYLKVTDFGFAKKTTERTYTFCGTPDYLAPEIVANSGHGPGADWWTLGVFLYEMLTGETPFYDEEGPSEMYEKILARDFTYPFGFDPDARDLIDGLLNIKPTKRFGVIRDPPIREHAWFEGLDWDALEAKTLDAPHKKPVDDKYDLSNFEQYDDDDEDANDEMDVLSDDEDPFKDF